ncbi:MULTISPECIES: ABC transporter substrate-binding protein [unclassified Halanaerobium]|uniref:ABC transporter substrate-binding protein n=1 Tax=unclassified Halanaerobium TaxID=2641197 RepID=UPI000DF3F6ED|nr:MULTISPECIES: ABC transporter substrate-binding protein [unclassified Halanaerobium]RCW48770.1 putative ABC transport system substrate-binding protein [Halanaerobium sp. MA284_MarDTE_T2]RCW89112.1 putative ABC transport system substrate-binding protein [Halanaerobium sp. DL-01]
MKKNFFTDFNFKIISLMIMTVLIFTISTGAAEYEIGISQFVEHPALDSAREGFIDALAEEDFVEGKNIEITLQNAQADMATAQSIAQRFKQQRPDLVLAITTQSAQTAVNVIKDIPILITAVTDPVVAGLVDSMEKPGGNVTGTTDMNPVAKQLDLVKQFIPNVKDIGILYNPGEVNSVVQVEIAKEKAEEMGVKLHEGTVTNSSEVSLAASALVDKVDAIYVPTDNIIVSALPAVLNITNPKKIPVFASENGQVKQGAVATLGIDYYMLGRQTGKMAARVLNGEKPADMSIEGAENPKLYLNKTACSNLGLEIPEEILEKADVIYE